MGVMSCSRNSCEHIMCDTYIVGIGYVCSSCQDEFKEYLKIHNYNPIKEYEIVQLLKGFIETEAKRYQGTDEMTVDEFFKNHNTRNEL